MHVCTAADTEFGINNVTTEIASTMDRNLIPSILVPILVVLILVLVIIIIIVVMLSLISVWRKRYIILMDRFYPLINVLNNCLQERYIIYSWTKACLEWNSKSSHNYYHDEKANYNIIVSRVYKEYTLDSVL